jgi:glucose-6-phosphate 1-dehydrogenase
MSSKFNIPTVVVVFGATGDLAQKKIFPALFNLFQKQQLPEKFSVIGSSRSDRSDETFREYVTDILQRFYGDELDPAQLDAFLPMISYEQAEFTNPKDYQELAQVLGKTDEHWSICSNKLFYLADSGLTEPCSPKEGWTRVLIEKPLGYDQKTAEEINELLGNLFQEEQIYRIDHYLAKEMIQNMLTFRFANNLMEESWSSDYIEKIEIRMMENFGVDNRGAFYDALGALRDVGQNHILQMLALTLMDCPHSFTEEAIREKRTQLLSKLMPMNLEQIKQQTFRAQYEGYQEVSEVASDSQTETYFRVNASVDHPRWWGMPIYLESGKRMSQTRNEIVVTFKKRFPTPANIAHQDIRNRVTFHIEPKEEIAITFVGKKPGLKFEGKEETFRSSMRSGKQASQKAEEYERVLLDCIRGDQMLFVSTAEVAAMWRFIDPIVCAWNDNQTLLHTYQPEDTAIVEQAAAFLDHEAATHAIERTVGMIGLGKMGKNVALQLLDHGWTVHGYNRTASVAEALATDGLQPAPTLAELVSRLPKPRVLWMMLPAGAPVADTLYGTETHPGLIDLLEPGDIVIDAGNSRFTDTKAHAQKLASKGIHLVDCGTSGGPGGARNGACLMVGGTREQFEFLLPLFQDVAISEGVAFFPGAGAGHFVKMVHNGIEYGMMQAIAEGFAVMNETPYSIDLTEAARIYNQGSVIESRLIGWLLQGMRSYDPQLSEFATTVGHSGEGQWTVETAKELGIATPIIEGSLQYRIDSASKPSFAGKVLNTLRRMFGGHENT